MDSLTDAQRERLMADLRVVITDAQELLRMGGQQTGAAADEWRSTVETKLTDAKLAIRDMQGVLLDRVRTASRATDDYVRENPWQSVGIVAGVAAAVGFALGFGVGRR